MHGKTTHGLPCARRLVEGHVPSLQGHLHGIRVPGKAVVSRLRQGDKRGGPGRQGEPLDEIRAGKEQLVLAQPQDVEGRRVRRPALLLPGRVIAPGDSVGLHDGRLALIGREDDVQDAGVPRLLESPVAPLGVRGKTEDGRTPHPGAARLAEHRNDVAGGPDDLAHRRVTREVQVGKRQGSSDWRGSHPWTGSTGRYYGLPCPGGGSSRPGTPRRNRSLCRSRTVSSPRLSRS